MQHVQDIALDVKPSPNQDCQNQATTAHVCSGECDQTALSHPGGSSGHSQRVPCPSSAERIDGDSEYDGGDEDEGDDGGEEDKWNDVDDDHLQDYGIKKPDAMMPSPIADSRMDSPTPEVRNEMMRSWSRTASTCRRWMGLKRARWEISEENEVKEMEGRRVKRMKRDGNPAGLTRQPLAECQGNLQSSSKGEHKRQGALTNTPHCPAKRPVGSAVQKINQNCLRRHAAKGTQKKSADFGYYPQPDIVVYASYYNAIGGSQSRPSSHRQRQAGSERTNPTLNPIVEDTAGDTHGSVSHGASEGNGSNDSGNQRNPGEMVQNDAHTERRGQYQQPAVNNVRDDPFFSDELFNGMLNGQPDNNHVGSMYTRSHQREIDEYYLRVTGPRPGVEPESNPPENPVPSAVQQQTTQNIPGARVHGGNGPPVAQAPTGALRLARASTNDLDFGDITDWNSAWSSFVNDHDSEPLLRGHYPDEHK